MSWSDPTGDELERMDEAQGLDERARLEGALHEIEVLTATLSTRDAEIEALNGERDAATARAERARDRSGLIHASDCAMHNEPAYPAGPCDCMVSVNRLMFWRGIYIALVEAIMDDAKRAPHLRLHATEARLASNQEAIVKDALLAIEAGGGE